MGFLSSVVVKAVFLLGLLIIYSDARLLNSDPRSEIASFFPANFYFGATSSVYQYEGAYNGKDQEIIDLVVSTGVYSFKFSISWAWILPNGTYGGINTDGIGFYNKLIDTLLSKGIEPYVVLHHFDFQVEEDRIYKSWLSPKSVEDFKYYADICFKNFGERIKYWFTFSEPNMMVMPIKDFEGDPKEVFGAVHNIILAHAAAVKIYKTVYQKEQRGHVGLVVETMWFEPLSDSTADKLAAEIAQSFYSNWFLDPIVFGRYPKEMTDILGDSLPKFSSNDLEDLKIGIDFLGINHYTSSYAWHCMNKSCASKMFGYVGQSMYKDGIPIAEKTGMDPKGMEKVLNYVKERFKNMPLYVSDHDYCEKKISNSNSSTREDSINDIKRVNFLTDYMNSLAAAIRDGANVRGYFYHIDFETDSIAPQSSAAWYKHFIEEHERSRVIVPKPKELLINFLIIVLVMITIAILLEEDDDDDLRT